MADNIDWDAPPASRLETATQKSQETGIPIVRQDSVLAPAYLPKQESSILPALGGAIGGIAGGLLIKNPMAGQTAGRALAGSLFPSLAGSSAGTALGTAAERGMEGDLFSSEGGKQMLGNLLENAAWDVGGNLVFSLAGKTYKVGKEAIAKFRGTGMTPEQEARNAAQAYLSQRGATLSLGQIEGTPGLKQAESIIMGGTGGKAFAEQKAGVSKAIQEGLNEVRNTLDTSPAFNQALSTDEPLNRAVGENFQNLISTARNDFKDTYRPFYDSLTKDYGVYINMRPIKDQAKAELERIVKSKGVGSSADKAAVLNDILKQDDFVEFGVAHDIRSSLNGAANDLSQPGKNATSKQAAYTKYANEVDQQMNKAVQLAASNKGQRDWIAKHGYQSIDTPEAGTLIVTGPAGFNPGMQSTQLSKDLVQKYNQVSDAYKAGMSGLYNETINTAMSKAPSKVGQYLADLSESEKFTDLFKAVSQVDQYAKTAGSTGAQAINDVRAEFLNTVLNTPEKAKSFATKLKEDDELRRSFYKMYRGQATQLKDILNAADIGLESAGTAASYLRTREAALGLQATGTIAGYFALPTDIQERLKDNLPSAALTAGALILTPAMLAKAATNKNAADALAGLAKYKEGTKMSGAVAAKIVDQLSKSGIISPEYTASIDSIFNAPAQQPQEVPKAADINWDTAPGQ
jgi:hypothetical protein